MRGIAFLSYAPHASFLAKRRVVLRFCDICKSRLNLPFIEESGSFVTPCLSLGYSRCSCQFTGGHQSLSTPRRYSLGNDFSSHVLQTLSALPPYMLYGRRAGAARSGGGRRGPKTGTESCSWPMAIAPGVALDRLCLHVL